MVGWLEFHFPFQHKYGYIRDETSPSLWMTNDPSMWSETYNFFTHFGFCFISFEYVKWHIIHQMASFLMTFS